MYFFVRLSFTAGCYVLIAARAAQDRSYEFEGQVEPIETPIFSFPSSGLDGSTVPKYELDLSTQDGEEVWLAQSPIFPNPSTESHATITNPEFSYMLSSSKHSSEISHKPSKVSTDMDTSTKFVVMATSVPVVQATSGIITPDNDRQNDNTNLSIQRIQPTQQQQPYTDFFTDVVSETMHTPSDPDVTEDEETALLATFPAARRPMTVIRQSQVSHSASTASTSALVSPSLETEEDTVRAAAVLQEGPTVSEGKTNRAAIIGGVLGGVAAVAAVAGAAAYLMQGPAVSDVTMAAPIISDASPNPTYIPAEAEGVNALYSTGAR